MNKLRYTVFAAMWALPLVAAADKLCDRCAWVDQATSPYLGSYWPHDRGTFEKDSTELTGNEFYVFDLNATATVSISVTEDALPTPLLLPVGFVLYPDAGTDCSAGGSLCGRGYYESETSVAGAVSFTKRTLRISVTLPPGRYLLRVVYADAPYHGVLKVQ